MEAWFGLKEKGEETVWDWIARKRYSMGLGRREEKQYGLRKKKGESALAK